MLATLIESKAHKQRNRRGTTLSIILHSTIILVAVYATASGSTNERIVAEPRLHWIPTTLAPSVPAQSAPSVPRPGRIVVGRSMIAPVEVPIAIPEINLSASPVTSNNFHNGAQTISTDANHTQRGNGNDQRAYDVSEVESPVSALQVVVPDYPAALRAADIEGRVSAEFVVMESGRVDVESLRILSTTNELFSDAVRRALPAMRFNPARIGGKAVAQLVRQEFVFRLAR